MTAATLPRPLASKLPNVGTTIFTQMSALALEAGAVNLGQGFPDFNCDPLLIDFITEAMKSGHNQYPPMTGIAALRDAIAKKIGEIYAGNYDPASEITITAGATQALFTAILCCVTTGDEVIVIEPAYDSYLPAIALSGAKPVLVSMEVGPAGFSIPWDKLAAAVTPKTRLIILNSPHNPSGSALGPKDIRALTEIVEGTDILLISDEVYEHMVYDGLRHESICRHPALAARALVISSFGKTYHVTGWKVGYVAAPAALSAEFRKLHQYNVFTVNTPMQHGLARHMQEPAHYRDLPAFYQRKRDMFRAGLQQTRFQLLPAEGTYFQCVKYEGISSMREIDFAKWLTKEIGVAAIPISAFYRDGKESGIVRFCFAKQDATLDLALERLKKI